MDVPNLRDVSPISHVLERMFDYIARLFPPRYLFLDAPAQAILDEDEKKREAWEIVKAKRIEYYIIIWVPTELFVAVLAPHSCSYGSWVLAIVLGYRILDILQSAINVNIFDRLRIREGKYSIALFERSVLLAFWNFLEAAFLFGALYSIPIFLFKYSITFPDTYYFSFITHLTIGYGDIQPLGATRLVAATQGLSGFILAVFAIARQITFLSTPDAFFRR